MYSANSQHAGNARDGAASSLSEAAEFWHEHDDALEQHARNGDVSLSHDLYRGMPEWFNAYFAHFQRRALLPLLRKCEIEPGILALDVGCGTGRWAGVLLSFGLQTYGFDLGARAVEYAAQRWRSARFSSMQLPFLGYRDNCFDLAISVTVLQHIPHDEQRSAIQSIARVLKPGGYVLACESIVTQDPSGHVFGNTAKDWLSLFQQAGLQVEGMAACEYLPHVKLFHWVRRLRRTNEGTNPIDVSSVARLLETNRLAALLVRLSIGVSYPLEYLATRLSPPSWARLRCFLLRKVPCASA